MHNLAIGFVILSTLLTIVMMYSLIRYGKCGSNKIEEGFSTTKGKLKKAKKETGNALLNVIAQAKKVSSYALDRSIWSDRLNMIHLSPMDLARKYINEQNKRSSE
jgi:hypothetical protein